MAFLTTLVAVILGDWIALGTYDKAKAWFSEKVEQLKKKKAE